MVNSAKVPYGYYDCTSYRASGKTGGKCSAHYVRYDVLYAYVLERIRYWSEQAELGEEKLLKRLIEAEADEQSNSKNKQTSALAKYEKRKAEIDRLFVRLYDDWASGKITEYNFNTLTTKYQTEQEELDKKIQAIRAELEAEKELKNNAEKWINLIRKYVHPTELTAELLNALIEKIVVHEATKRPDGTREQEIEIFYRFIGKIEE